MGLFDFFRKKSSDSQPFEKKQTNPIENNAYLLETLKTRLIDLGYQVEKHPQYLALIVNAEVEIATVIVEIPNSHPNILQLMILTIHPKYFPDGIEENIVGIGTNLEEKVNSVIDNYLNTTFHPIIDSFADSHYPELDFTLLMNETEVLWHPKLGNLTPQGQWHEQLENEPFFEIIKPILKDKLTSNKFNWLKLYITKQANGTIIGECLFNNEPWEEGLAAISAYAKSWDLKSDFQGLKQFIVFRKCDAFDE